MANNGYLDNGVCVSTALVGLKSVCPANSSLFRVDYTSTNSQSTVLCYVYGQSGLISTPASFPAYNCEISSGLPLTETQQIEAINALFPSAIAILAIAWGFKYIRVLVAEWLKERNASD